ncbi:hypothetical protein HDU87_003411 [Geranomyces variabilis]|uniref:Uncharacterized protein n=1 Tax=Geranomyces variabilis TaxID=109894 RepID=A0AAD5XQH3_9FUNG|nr:hypothetical protein HDU87_003411 [Geranomyces variabilis]
MALVDRETDRLYRIRWLCELIGLKKYHNFRTTDVSKNELALLGEMEEHAVSEEYQKLANLIFDRIQGAVELLRALHPEFGVLYVNLAGCPAGMSSEQQLQYYTETLGHHILQIPCEGKL